MTDHFRSSLTLDISTRPLLYPGAPECNSYNTMIHFAPGRVTVLKRAFGDFLQLFRREFWVIYYMLLGLEDRRFDRLTDIKFRDHDVYEQIRSVYVYEWWTQRSTTV